MSIINPLTPAGIEPATFRFVAQQLNHCATAVRRGASGDELIKKYKDGLLSFESRMLNTPFESASYPSNS